VGFFFFFELLFPTSLPYTNFSSSTVKIPYGNFQVQISLPYTNLVVACHIWLQQLQIFELLFPTSLHYALGFFFFFTDFKDASPHIDLVLLEKINI
jgi:hypothetical protein